MHLRPAIASILLMAALTGVPAAPAAEAPPGPRPLRSFQEKEAACAPVRERIASEVAALGGACHADSECTRAMPEYLRCGTWVHRDFAPSDDLMRTLEASCAAVSLEPTCPDEVGACVAGRCTGRAPRRDTAACEAARSMPAGESEVLTACGEQAPRAPAVVSAPPQQVEKGCIWNSVRIPRDLARFSGKVTLRFRVSPRGVAHGFSVEGSPDPRLDESLALAVSGCELRPFLEAGVPREGASSIDIRFTPPR